MSLRSILLPAGSGHWRIGLVGEGWQTDNRRWWIAGLVLHRSDYGWLIPFLLWLFIMIRLVTFYVPSRYAMMPVAFVWKNVVQRVVYMIPEHLRLPLGAAGSVAVILVGTFVTEESQDNTRANRAVSCFGLIVFVAGFWATSRDRKRVQWHTVIVGMLAQFVLAVFVLRTKAGVSLLPPVLFSDTKARAPSTTSSTSSPS